MPAVQCTRAHIIINIIIISHSYLLLYYVPHILLSYIAPTWKSLHCIQNYNESPFCCNTRLLMCSFQGKCKNMQKIFIRNEWRIFRMAENLNKLQKEKWFIFHKTSNIINCHSYLALSITWMRLCMQDESVMSSVL